MFNHALVSFFSHFGHHLQIALLIIVHLLHDAWLIGTISKQIEDSLHTVVIICVNYLIFLYWPELESLLAKAVTEILVIVVQLLKFLFNDFYVLRVF